MKTISIKQPWASLICTSRQENPNLGIKDIENRTWPTKFRGRVLVHASAKFDYSIFSVDTDSEKWESFTKTSNYPTGAIIGSVEIVDYVINYPSIWAEGTFFPIDDSEGYPPKQIIYNWVLANPVLFAKPIPAKGKLSFWDFPMTEHEYLNHEKIGNPLMPELQ
jgi:hypothetical protein